jgi:hypothetical protein
MQSIIATAQDHPKVTAWIGTLSGWAGFNWLHTAQLAAAILAGLVSLCALILTAPKAVKEVRRWFA